MRIDLTCPNCDNETEDEIEDVDEYDQYEHTCTECGVKFGYTISVIISPTEFKLLCGGQESEGPHKWKKVIGWPAEIFKDQFICEYCGLIETRKSE